MWWHAKSHWILGLFPMDYVIGIAISLACAEGAAYDTGSQAPFIEHLLLLCGFGLATIMLHLATPMYQRWYYRMRERDDRDKTDIFHDKAA